MSKIQEAIRKLQASEQPKKATDEQAMMMTRHRLPKSVIPMARKKNLFIDGEKHHLDEENLIRGGLLAPLDHAVPVADEFRRIKRPLIDNVVKARGNENDHMNLIMVSSAMPGAGKTFCSVNLAASIICHAYRCRRSKTTHQQSVRSWRTPRVDRHS
jgi:Mrp family chromosome partitioning ATPase